MPYDWQAIGLLVRVGTIRFSFQDFTLKFGGVTVSVVRKVGVIRTSDLYGVLPTSETPLFVQS